MATLSILADRKQLVRLGGGLALGEQPLRLLYAFPHVATWLDNSLSTIIPMPDSELRPTEQVDALFYDFVSGEDFAYYERSHRMKPIDQGIWDFKTEDIRIFGWFHVKCTFVMANIDSMERVKNHGLYAGYRDDCIRRREALDLDPPKFVLGTYSDVL